MNKSKMELCCIMDKVFIENRRMYMRRFLMFCKTYKFLQKHLTMFGNVLYLGKRQCFTKHYDITE